MEYLYEYQNWNFFENEFFRIAYHNKWQLINPEIPIVKYQCVSGEDEDYFLSTTVEVIELEEELKLNEQKENLRKHLSKFIFGLNDLHIEELEGNCNGLKVEFNGVMENEKVKYIMYQWFIGGIGITITFSMDYDSQDITKSLTDLIIRLFKIK